MLNERPSNKKVAVVSRRYLNAEEQHLELAEYVNIFETKDLSVTEAYAVMFAITCLAVTTAARIPVQKSRESFLSHAQNLEGMAPGEEKLAAFALRRSGAADAYPRVMRHYSQVQ